MIEDDPKISVNFTVNARALIGIISHYVRATSKVLFELNEEPKI